MIKLRRTFLATLAASASMVAVAAIPSTAAADGHNPYAPVTIYVTRHAEKKTELETLDNGDFREICGSDKCAEILSTEGELRAELLADWMTQRGITGALTHAFSSHKNRTRQTITPTVERAGLSLSNDNDGFADGIQQIAAVPYGNGAVITELNDGNDSEGTSGTVAPTVAAIQGLPGGSVALVAGHSGSIYKIFDGLGLDTSDDRNYPRSGSGKVRNFGDIWKVQIDSNGNAQLHWRVQLVAGPLRGIW